MIDSLPGVLNALSAKWSVWMIQMTWQVAVLVMVVWAVSRLFQKSPAGFRHLLWLVVFAKLLVPPTLATPWSPANFMPKISVDSRFPVADVPVPADAIRPSTNSPPAGTAPSRNVVPETGVEAGEGLVRDPLSPATVAMCVWAAVALALFAVLAFQYRRYGRRLLEKTSPAPERFRQILSELAKSLSVKRPPRLMVSAAIHTPAVFGFWRPVVLLPADWEENLTSEEVALVMTHELAHIKRWDMTIAWLTTLMGCVYWFHPAIWYTHMQMRREREMACDDMVLRTTKQEGKRYASTILHVAESFTGAIPAAAGFLGLLEVSDNLLHRVRSVADTTRRRRTGWRSIIGLALIAALFVPMGVWVEPSGAQELSAKQIYEWEVKTYYGRADSEVRGFLLKTADFVVRNKLWVPDKAYDDLGADEREAWILECVKALEGPYGRGLCGALTAAAALDDRRLIPGLKRVAAYRLGERIDNRPRWMAAAALARVGDQSVVPTLIPMVDYYNKDASMWSQAALVRITGKNFGVDKRAWANWWNAGDGREPKIDIAALKPWVMPETKRTAPTPDTDEMKAIMAAADKEIERYYKKADPGVQEYIRWTAGTFGRPGADLWLPESAFDLMTQEERDEKVEYSVRVLEGDYGRHQCTTLVAAGVLKDKRLLPGVLKAATYHRDDRNYDCRTKWMAVAALGRLGDETAVPALVPLVDHGNENTRMWARASLVRLTGQNFDDDKTAWAAWWNGLGKTPRIEGDALKPWKPIAEAAPKSEGGPPEIVAASPAIGATAVDPALAEIRVTFDQDMRMGSYSWTGGGEQYPEVTGKPKWIDKRTCALPVALEPAKFYRVGINSKSHKNFRGANGVPARTRVLSFTTAGARKSEMAWLKSPTIVSMKPENGDKVRSTLEELSVTFDQPMGGGFSWVRGFGNFPEIVGRPRWSENQKTCSVTVKLKSGTTYRFSLNSDKFNNFQNAGGVPLEPVIWKFSTSE